MSADLMMKITKKYLMPEKAEKVGEILKLLTQHLFKLKLKYFLFEDDMSFISIESSNIGDIIFVIHNLNLYYIILKSCFSSST